jgi:hypothetical protein
VRSGGVRAGSAATGGFHNDRYLGEEMLTG